MGTVASVRTRSYHGLLIASLTPPLGRTLLLASLEETVIVNGQTYELFANSWNPGGITPQGYSYIDTFILDGTMPVWVYKVSGVTIEKRVWMQPGENTTYVRYTLLYASGPVDLSIKTLVNYRDHHTTSKGELALQVTQVPKGLRIAASNGEPPYFIFSDVANAQPEHILYENLYLSSEAERGLGANDTNLFAGVLHASLNAGDNFVIAASTREDINLDGQLALTERQQYEKKLISQAPPNTHAHASARQLVLAADQFVVKRGHNDSDDGCTVIAGYPWFGDWGRDTMISLPGLFLGTGRSEQAGSVLKTFAHYVSEGMLPNRFPDTSEQPEYNTVDATLWYFQAINAYYTQTKDKHLLRDLYPVLCDIVDWHVRSTRHRIHVDPEDHLLYAGEPGVQLTWMDAKYNNWVVTPRIGKPVEINALWYNALAVLADFAHQLADTEQAKKYKAQTRQVKNSFQKFWNGDTGYCYDVLDGPNGHEASLRPNQLLAVSLPYTPLTKPQQKAVVDSCEQSLLTPYGLRSLAPNEPGYIGKYEGGTEQRDGSYHQGTVWAWLIGPFVEAHLRVYADKARAGLFLKPLMQTHLKDFGLGSVSEIFDGDAPFIARGCPWQAWSVAELLRVWQLTVQDD